MAIYKQLQTGSAEEEKRRQSLAGAGSNSNGAAAQQPESTAQQTQSQPGTAQRSAQAPDYSQYAYDPGMDVAYQQALQALQQAQQQMPTYRGTYDQQLDEVYQQIVGRDKFSYDINGDALYQQYADQYTQRGQMAMMDNMGQAAALTGGYGSSYAQNVGQQAYQGYLQQLNDVVPELYGMALDQYNREGDMMMQQYGMLGDLADKEYGRYQDDLAQYWQQLAFQKQQADDAYNRGYENWYTAYQNQYQAGRDQAADQKWQQEFEYQQGRDQVADDRYNKEFEYQQGRDQVADKQWQQQFDESQRQYDEQFQYQQDRDKVSDQQWRDAFDYQAGRDQVADQQWKDAFDYQAGRDQVADKQWQDAFDYEQSRDQASDKQWQDAFDYQVGRDDVADKQWQAQFDESKRQYDQEYEFALKQYTDAHGDTGGTSSGGGTTSGGNTSTGAGWNNGSLSEAEIVQLQNALGVDADGLYGPISKEAAGGLSAEEAYNKYVGGTPVFDYSSNQEAAVENGGSYYSTVLADLKEMKQSSRSNADANKFLKEMLDNDLLTPSEYSKLYNMYRNNSL